MPNPNWTIEELTLALELYFQEPRAIGDSNHPEVIALSETLNKLNLHPRENSDIKFRNPNGVATKLSNLRHHDPTRPGEGLSHGSRLDKTIWEMYGNNHSELQQAAAKIREDHSIYDIHGAPNITQIRETISKIRILLDDLESML